MTEERAFENADREQLHVLIWANQAYFFDISEQRLGRSVFSGATPRLRTG